MTYKVEKGDWKTKKCDDFISLHHTAKAERCGIQLNSVTTTSVCATPRL
jgi:hypothetical protein